MLTRGLCANAHHPSACKCAQPAQSLAGVQRGQLIPFCGGTIHLFYTVTSLQKALPVCILGRSENKWVIAELRGTEK